jgi:hypothetical protein
MSRYYYSNDRRDPTGAMPVYLVAAPAPGPPWPSDQLTGGIPVIFGLVGITPNSGPIPVRIVSGTGPGPKWPSNQGDDGGAIPVYNSTALNAMPVWDATGAPPLPPPIITASVFIHAYQDIIAVGGIEIMGSCVATNGPVTWSMGANATPLDLRINAISGQIVLTNGLDSAVTVGNYQFRVNAANSSAFDSETITIILT